MADRDRLTTQTPERDDRFFAWLADGYSVTRAAREAGYHRSMVYVYKAAQPDFAQRWADAYEQGGDVFEDAGRRRAVDGIERDVYYRGAVVGEETQYSDNLLMFFLKSRRPDQYRDNARVEQVNSGGIAITTEDVTSPETIAARLAAVIDMESRGGQ